MLNGFYKIVGGVACFTRFKEKGKYVFSVQVIDHDLIFADYALNGGEKLVHAAWVNYGAAYFDHVIATPDDRADSRVLKPALALAGNRLCKVMRAVADEGGAFLAKRCYYNFTRSSFG